MSKYSRIYADAYERWDEVTCEEWRIFELVILHSYFDEKTDTRRCTMPVKKICKIHNLDPDNTYRRLIRLRTGEFAPKEQSKKVAPMQSPWLYEANDGALLPLLGIKETVKNTVYMEKETVKNTVSNCKKYSNSRRKTVKNTVPFKKDLNNSLNNSHTNENPGVSVNENSNGNKSIYSLAECLQYTEKLKADGAVIHNPQGLAMALYKSGDADPFIQATLYPETTPETPPDAKDDERQANCPRCYGGGMEFMYDEEGNQLGVRPNCKHEPLREGEYLYKWKVEHEISES
jgi:hypothetical protein